MWVICNVNFAKLLNVMSIGLYNTRYRPNLYTVHILIIHHALLKADTLEIQWYFDRISISMCLHI